MRNRQARRDRKSCSGTSCVFVLVRAELDALKWQWALELAGVYQVLRWLTPAFSAWNEHTGFVYVLQG